VHKSDDGEQAMGEKLRCVQVRHTQS